MLIYSYSIPKENKKFLNDKVAKKILKDDVYGKKICSRVLADLLELDYDEVYHGLEKVSEDIAFSSLTVDNRVDTLLRNDKMIIDLEINNTKYPSKPQVLETYVYQLVLSQIKTHKDYNKIKEVVQISIDAYDFFERNEFIYKCYLQEEVTHQKVSNSFIMYHVNLDYIREMNYNQIKQNKLMYDLYFLICGEEELDEIYKGDKFMEKIINNAKEVAGEMNEPLFASEEEIMKLDEAYIREQATKAGILKTQCEMILNLYKKKIPIETIAEYTNLSIDEVKKIITEKTSDNAKEVAEEANKPLFTSEEEIMKLDEAYIREQATKAGILQKEREMILNLYKNEVPVEIIAKSANLSIDEVKKIVMGK